MIHEILGWIENISVRVLNRRREKSSERKERRKRNTKENKGNPGKNLLYKRWTGWVLTRSSAPCFRPLDLGPDGSGSIQRFWSVLEIRIHQLRGFGPGSLGFFNFFSVSWVSLLRTPPVFAIWTICALWISCKNAKKLLCVLDVFLTVFVMFSHV